MNYLKLLLGLIFIVSIDNIYIYLNKSMYKPIMDPSGKINFIAAILSWVVIIAGIQLLVLSRNDLTKENSFMYGAFLGFSMYALYNMTNFATYPDKWSIQIAFFDTLWGALLSGATAYLMYNYF